jgi:hypothetical protein
MKPPAPGRGERMRWFRETLSNTKSLRAFAALAKVSPGAVSRWETLGAMPDTQVLHDLMSALAIENAAEAVIWLLHGHGQPPRRAGFEPPTPPPARPPASLDSTGTGEGRGVVIIDLPTVLMMRHTLYGAMQTRNLDLVEGVYKLLGDRLTATGTHGREPRAKDRTWLEPVNNTPSPPTPEPSSEPSSTPSTHEKRSSLVSGAAA